MMRLKWGVAGVLLLLATAAGAQSLSDQVLQLLTRINAWTALQTFNVGISFADDVPSDTTDKLYRSGDDLFWNGTPLSAGAATLTPHDVLSVTHADTAPDTLARGDLITAQGASPAWTRLPKGSEGTVLRMGANEPAWSTDGSFLTNLTAANLSGALPGISGASLTNLNAANLASGTVPLARLSGITNTEIAAAAGIAYSKLNLSGSVSLISDITGTLPMGNGGTGLSSATDDALLVGNGTGYNLKSVADCDGASSALNYDTSTNAFSCRTLSLGAGTVTSVALSLPAIFTVSGSPVTSTGTLTGTLATQTANRVWAGPSSGSAAAPTFRALVNADLPLTGVGAGTYSAVTVNTAGVVTAGADADLTTDVTGTLPAANGGLGITTVTDNTTIVANGSVWVAATLPDCVAGSCWGIGFTQATNLFAAITSRTIAFQSWLDTGYCQNTTVVLEWSTPTSDPGVGACVTGTNTQKLVVDFADGANALSIQKQWKLPSDWTGALDLNIWWYTSATTGDVVWQIQTACVGSTQTGDPSFNTASTTTDAALGTTNQYNLATILSITATGCDAGDVLYLKLTRDPAHASDDLAATARLVGAELVYRRAI